MFVINQASFVKRDYFWVSIKIEVLYFFGGGDRKSALHAMHTGLPCVQCTQATLYLYATLRPLLGPMRSPIDVCVYG